MSRILFVFVELLKASLSTWHMWVAFSIAIALALAGGSSVALLQEGFEACGPREAWIAVIQFPQGEIPRDPNRLAWALWDIEGVKRVSYRFPGEKIPGEGSAEFTSILVWFDSKESLEAARGRIEEEVSGLGAVLDEVHFENPGPWRLPPLSRVVASVILVIAAFSALVFGKAAMRMTVQAWENELQLLRISGVEPWGLSLSLVGVAAVWGLAGGAIYVGLYEGLRPLAQRLEAVRQLAPGYLSPSSFPYLAGLVIAPVFACLVGTLSLLLIFPWRRGAENRF